jgi:hypothetical protein
MARRFRERPCAYQLMLDRLLHQSHIVQIAGESYRLMEKDKEKEKRIAAKHNALSVMSDVRLAPTAVFLAPSIALDWPVLL